MRGMDKNVSRAFRGFLRFLRILKLILKLDERIKYSNIIFNFSFFSFAITIEPKKNRIEITFSISLIQGSTISYNYSIPSYDV